MAALSACSGGSQGPGIPAAQVSQRYEAAIGPANTAISAFVTKAVAVSAGAPGGLNAESHRTAAAVHKAAGQIGGIDADPQLRRDITDVAGTLSALFDDLNTLSSAKGGEVPPAVARVVADAGREAAADDLVKLALIAATTPTTVPPVTVPPDTTTVAETTTTVARTTTPRRTTTTRPRTTTTVARTTTT